MLDSVNLVQFKKAFRGSLSDMLVITEACVEKNTQVLNKVLLHLSSVVFISGPNLNCDYNWLLIIFAIMLLVNDLKSLLLN